MAIRSIEQRTAEILSALRSNGNRAEVARQFGVSREWVRQIGKRYSIPTRTHKLKARKRVFGPGFYKRMGRLGGLIGGPARARKLSKRDLSEQGRKAVIARWAKVKGTGGSESLLTDK